MPGCRGWSATSWRRSMRRSRLPRPARSRCPSTPPTMCSPPDEDDTPSRPSRSRCVLGVDPFRSGDVAMRELTYGEAALEAIAEEMRRDDKIFYMSTDAIDPLLQEFGKERVRATPIT